MAGDIRGGESNKPVAGLVRASRPHEAVWQPAGGVLWKAGTDSLQAPLLAELRTYRG